MKRSSPRQHGFSLLEVLVAMVILALVYGTLLRAFGGAIRNSDRIEDQRMALMVAQSVIETTRGATPAERQGDVQGYHWRVETSDLADALGGGFVAADGPEVVTVTVSWQPAPGRERSIALQTVRLAGRSR